MAVQIFCSKGGENLEKEQKDSEPAPAQGPAGGEKK